MNERSQKLLALTLISQSSLLLMLLVSHFCKNSYELSLIADVVIVMFEIIVPIEILRILKIPCQQLNIYAYNIDLIVDLALPPYGKKGIRPDFRGLFQELRSFIKVSVVTLIPYIFCYWAWMSFLAFKDQSPLTISLSWPPQMIYLVITQIFAIALPEEIFYRGFMQGALLRIFPNRTFIFGAPVGLAVVLTNLGFALGHVLVSLSPIRMLTFFPGLIFSYLVYKNRSIVGATLYHAACNILGQILYLSFTY
jgi:membrane protease YdiL (CAAX protease family)